MKYILLLGMNELHVFSLNSELQKEAYMVCRHTHMKQFHFGWNDFQEI